MMYDFETASAVLRDMERDRRHFRIKTGKRLEQTATRFARFRVRAGAAWPRLATLVSRISSRF